MDSNISTQNKLFNSNQRANCFDKENNSQVANLYDERLNSHQDKIDQIFKMVDSISKHQSYIFICKQ